MSKTPQIPSAATLSPTSVVATASTTPSSSNNAAVKYSSQSGSTSATSPASVSMVHSSSLASLLPSGAATVTTSNTKSKEGSNKTVVIPKPFFVMDWLEEINPRDLELARQMLQTPTKKTNKGHPLQAVTSPLSFQKSSKQPGSKDRRQERFQYHQNDHDNDVVDESPPTASSRSSINLPTLHPTFEYEDNGSNSNDNNDKGISSDDEGNVCRQLYPAEQAPQPTNDDDENPNSDEAKGQQTNNDAVSKSGPPSPQPTTQSKSSAAAKMSPFRKRSIAIGNGWNAKGLHKAKKGSWESALACWENALVIRTQVLGETHPDVANTCNNIGIALGKLGRYDAAIEMLERALELRAKHYGTREHVEVAATLHNIGNVLHAAQDSAGAIQCFWDAKLLQEQLLGPNHIQVARACVAIANVYNEALQFQDAMEAYSDALNIFAKAGLADNNPEVTSVHQDLVDVEQRFAIHQHSIYHNHWRQWYPAMANGYYPSHQEQGSNLHNYR